MTPWLDSWRGFFEKNPMLELSLHRPFFPTPGISPESLAKEEAFWSTVRSHFPKHRKVINLNNGGVSSSPLLVEQAFVRYYSLLNQSPSYFTWKVMEMGRELIRQGLAELINACTEEVAILRNTSEALNNVIFGVPLKTGDEVIACRQDYSKCVSSWQQRALRDGIKINWVNLGDPAEKDEDIIAKYVAAMTANAKLVHLTHVINWNGQVLPIKDIIAEAKKRNIEVLLDGAHSFALLEVDVQKLGIDYFTTALHKWLSGPIPSGMLYVSKDKIKNLWPLASAMDPSSDNIRKMEELSIQQMPILLGLGYAMEYYRWIGRQNKEQRLRYLRRSLVKALSSIPGVTLLTPAEEERQCIIICIALDGWAPSLLEKELLDTYNMHVTAVQWENIKGIRITANIYSRPDELAKLAYALKVITESKTVL